MKTAQQLKQPAALPYRLPLADIDHLPGAAYIYDGSFEGLLSAIFAITAAHDTGADIMREGDLQPRLGQELIAVETNLSHAQRIRRTILCAYGPQVFKSIYHAALSDNAAAPLIVYRFVTYALKLHNPCAHCPRKSCCANPCTQSASSAILDDLGNPIVLALVDAARATVNEWDRLRQFIRFEHREGDVWFARCNPRAFVVPLLLPWFADRFNGQRFVIYDETHHVSGVWDGTYAHLVKSDDVTPPPYTTEESQMQHAWINYWNHITVAERYNPELQRQYMPKRLWRNITEVRAQPAYTPGQTTTVGASTNREPQARPSHRRAG